MGKCQTCGKNCDGDYCFHHKLRKPLSKDRGFSKKIKIIETNTKMKDFFISIWEKKKHICENCNKPLGKEALSYMFDHILEKSKYPELKYEEQNIWLLCLNCHENKTNCNFSETMINKIKLTKIMFGK